MDTIETTLEPDADGTLHLPLPAGLRHGKIKVTATLVPVDEEDEPAPRVQGFGRLKGKIALAPDFDEPIDDFKEYME